MKYTMKYITLLVLAWLISLGLTSQALAQSNIFNDQNRRLKDLFGRQLPDRDKGPGYQFDIRYFRVARTAVGVGATLAIIGIIISGYQYMLAAGSEDATKLAKRNLLYLTIGLIFLLAALPIVNLVGKIVSGQSIF